MDSEPRSHFLSCGTTDILNGKYDNARMMAALARFIDQMIEVYLLKTQAFLENQKIIEMLHCDEHTLVSFFRNRIPCSCLRVKYKEVRHITKLGLCMNPNCGVPDRMVDRSTMFYCTRCCQNYYCSAECQKVAWPRHKEMCNTKVAEQAAFDSKQKQEVENDP